MPVYVDHFKAPFRGMLMSHLVADTTTELNCMADKIGVAHKWIQKPGTVYEHYDVCESKRVLAIQHGALEVSSRDLALLWRKKKEERLAQK